MILNGFNLLWYDCIIGMSMFVNSLLNYAYFEIFAYPCAKHKTEKHN